MQNLFSLILNFAIRCSSLRITAGYSGFCDDNFVRLPQPPGGASPTLRLPRGSITDRVRPMRWPLCASHGLNVNAKNHKNRRKVKIFGQIRQKLEKNVKTNHEFTQIIQKLCRASPTLPLILHSPCLRGEYYSKIHLTPVR